MLIGRVVQWSIYTGLPSKVAKRRPDYLLVIDYEDESTYKAVPCWEKDPGYSLCVFAKPQNVYVDCRKIVSVNAESLCCCEEYLLADKEEAIRRILEKNSEIKEKKHLARLERNQKRQEAVVRKKEQKRKKAKRKSRIENTYGREYELAVINNDTRRMDEIKKIVGYDPRPKGGSMKSGTNLSDVSNTKPYVGGRVSPK